jgi:hypothetical protein
MNGRDERLIVKVDHNDHERTVGVAFTETDARTIVAALNRMEWNVPMVGDVWANREDGRKLDVLDNHGGAYVCRRWRGSTTRLSYLDLNLEWELQSRKPTEGGSDAT